MANNEHTLLSLTCSQFLDSHINYWLSIGFQGIRWMQANGTFWLAHTFLAHTIKWLLYNYASKNNWFLITFWAIFSSFPTQYSTVQYCNTLSKMKKSFTTVRSFAQWHSKRFVFDNNRAVGQRVSHNMKLLSLTQPLLTPTSWDQLMASLVFFFSIPYLPVYNAHFFRAEKGPKTAIHKGSLLEDQVSWGRWQLWSREGNGK